MRAPVIAPASPLLLRRLLATLGAGSVLVAGCGGSTSTELSDTGGVADVGTGDATGDTGLDDTGTDVADAADARPDVPCVRRPFLVGAEPRAGALVERDDWSLAVEPLAAPLDAITARALADAWAEDGLQEHASIAAFSRFTLLALAVGAPPEHVVGAQRASLDEVRHAQACFALSLRYGGGAPGPGPVSLDGALAGVTLEALAVLTVHEGCVGETLGVFLAEAQLRATRDPVVRRVLARIVRDELRHAELAWSFVRWALRVDPSLRPAIARAFDDAGAASRAIRGAEPAGIDLEAWRAHGRSTGAEVQTLVRRGLATVVAPCRQVLLAEPSPAAPIACDGARVPFAPNA